MNTIFLSFSITNSSITDYMLCVAIKLSKKNKVVIVTDRISRTLFEPSNNIDLYSWPSVRPTKLKDFLFLCKLVFKYKPTTMLSLFGAVNLFTIVGWLFNVKTRIAFVQTLSSQFESKKNLVERKKIVYKFCTNIFANSNSTRDDLIINFNVPNDKITTIYNAVQTPKLIQDSVDQNKIVYVGRLHPSKGVTNLIEAISIVVVKYPNIQLSIIGGELDSDYALQCFELVEKLNLSSNINFLGSRSKTEVLQHFSTAYFSIVPSIFEAFGFVVIESFSTKTPVIGSNSSGISEIIRHGLDGFLFETNNIEDMAKYMLRVLSDKELRKIMSINCYDRFYNNFDVHILSKKIEVFIDSRNAS
ncbi:MAG: glycosyltransferase family 4 protein [Flavobacterium sp.]